MLNKKGWALGCLGLLAGLPIASADMVTSDTTVASDMLIQSFAYLGRIKKRESDTRWSWNLGLTFSRSDSVDSLTTTEVSNRTLELNGGLGWSKGPYSAGAGLSYSTTPAESVNSIGTNLYYGYTHTFPARSDEQAFQPSLGGRATLSITRYTQTYGTTSRLSTSGNGNGSRRRQASTSVNPNAITQLGPGAEVNGSPWEWVWGRLSHTRYVYSKNVNSFTGQLDSGTAVRQGSSGFSSVLAGFPSYMTTFQSIFYPSDSWDIDFALNWSSNKSDGTDTRGTRIIVSHDFPRNWRLGGGFERDRSEAVTQNMLLVSVGYVF